ncbi:cellobiase CelA precursor (plasmid) [Tistrella mobilis KA081020-065]|uniref:Cellobiase CelA n=2 Tax=Tistrella mobilis TaxID=171437 RepID=I3TSP2_TISMK|nr:cellobiase CelA precursor [Tistrella mobilis KA081020-065]
MGRRRAGRRATGLMIRAAAALMALVLTSGGAGAAGTVTPEIWPVPARALAADPVLEAQIDALLGRMTLDEKVGQTIMADVAEVTPADLARWPLGALFAGGNSSPGGTGLVPRERWLAAADAYHAASLARSGIPVIWGTDAVHGHNRLIGATVFPHNIALGAAGDPDLVRRVGRAIAAEVAATGLDQSFGPTLAVARDARWGRVYESFGSDPALVARLAGAAVEGLQGRVGQDFLKDGRVIATAKHFIGDGGTTKGTDRGDTQLPEVVLRDIHGAGYPPALAAGVQTVMASFSSWNGAALHGHQGLLTRVLKDRMGFDGILLGDWDGHAALPGCTPGSCPAAMTAGLDMFMAATDWRGLFQDTVRRVQTGEIAMARLDDAVRRILRVKLRSGLFDRPAPSERAAGLPEPGAAAHRALAREAVRRSLVLLKNDGNLLPIDPGLRVAVVGPGADDIGMQSGGWTLDWQGGIGRNGMFPGATSVFDGIREAVTRAGGSAELAPDGRFATRPDVVIAVFGETPYAEMAGDRPDLDFGRSDGGRAQAMLQNLKAAGLPVVSVFLSGRPLFIGPEMAASDAFIAAWLPGSEGAGIADVLFRAADGTIAHPFTGRLPMAWPGAGDAARIPE